MGGWSWSGPGVYERACAHALVHRAERTHTQRHRRDTSTPEIPPERPLQLLARDPVI